MNTGVKVVLALLWINNAMGLKSVRMDPMRNIVQPKHFQCNEGTILEMSKVCDGFPDCPDGEDENDCLVNQGLVETISFCDPLDDFTCKNGECTDFVNKCDG